MTIGARGSLLDEADSLTTSILVVVRLPVGDDEVNTG
jgi:hypothetical protein